MLPTHQPQFLTPRFARRCRLAHHRLGSALEGATQTLRRWRLEGNKPETAPAFLSEMTKLRELRVVGGELAREMMDEEGWSAEERLYRGCLGHVADAAGDIAEAWGRILATQYTVPHPDQAINPTTFI